jgi:hypothetical protein
MGGPMQRMTPPRGMVPLGPQVNNQHRKVDAELFVFILIIQIIIIQLIIQNNTDCIIC